jgi:multidrug efflux pump subunit AcrB
MPGEYDRYNMKRELTLTANIAGADLGRTSQDVVRALDQVQREDNAQKDTLEKQGQKPGRVTYELRGQIPPLRQMLSGLGVGLALAVLVIFLTLSANFQSFRLALVAVSAAPAVIAGVLLALWMTRSTLNIQSFIGAIMGLGVAMANAILFVTFADQYRREGQPVRDAAVQGGSSRLRPIVMTSAAMLAGMLPMAMAFGEAGQQTAPLGRAVMGALSAATLTTLFVVPAVFVLLQSSRSPKSASLDPLDPVSPYHSPNPVPAG